MPYYFAEYPYRNDRGLVNVSTVRNLSNCLYRFIERLPVILRLSGGGLAKRVCLSKGALETRSGSTFLYAAAFNRRKIWWSDALQTSK